MGSRRPEVKARKNRAARNKRALTFKVRVFRGFAVDHQALPPTRQLETSVLGSTGRSERALRAQGCTPQGLPCPCPPSHLLLPDIWGGGRAQRGLALFLSARGICELVPGGSGR